ncbi:MAG: helix-turn-helix transcriptional regulator [Bryobacteraceae bacterium]
MSSHIRLGRVPEDMRKDIVATRRKRGWSQAELGRRVGLPQAHISGIEGGKIVPRLDTFLDLVRILELDLLLIPRPLVPAIEALVRSFRRAGEGDQEEDSRPMYEPDEEDDLEA